MLSNYSFLINLFVFIIFIILSNSSFNDPCTYKVSRYQAGTNKTDENFLKNINSELAKKQKCFSLSKSDVESSLCCYDKINQLCAKPSDSNEDIDCPKESTIVNNCGMAGFYEPVYHERCTEISLVDGFCCYVETKTYGNACIRRKEIGEDDKEAITDDIINYLKNQQTPVPQEDIKSVKCEGTFIKNYLGKILFFTAIIACL